MRSAWWANCFTGYWPGIQFWKQCKEIPLLSTWLFVISTPWLLSVHQLHWPDCEMLLWHSSHLQAGSICMTISVTGLNLGQFETNIFNNLRKIHFVIWGKYILIFSTGRNCMTISVTGLNLGQWRRISVWPVKLTLLLLSSQPSHARGKTKPPVNNYPLLSSANNVPPRIRQLKIHFGREVFIKIWKKLRAWNWPVIQYICALGMHKRSWEVGIVNLFEIF